MHICMFACLRATLAVHVVETVATQTGVASHTAIGGACVQCLARGSHPPARPRMVYFVLVLRVRGVVRSYSWVLLEACFRRATRGATGR